MPRRHGASPELSMRSDATVMNNFGYDHSSQKLDGAVGATDLPAGSLRTRALR
jgi:hypothetical protein